MPTPLRPILAAAVFGLAFGACGGGRSTTPTATRTPDPRIPVGSEITVLSGETGAPVAGASVSVAGRVQTTDGGGVVRLAEAVSPGAALDIVAPGMLDRQTSLRAAGPQVLWPRTTANGIDEHYTATLVYTPATREPGPVGSEPLRRLSTSTATVVVVPSAGLLADDRAMAFHRQAVDRLTAATGGAVTFMLAESAPATGVVFTTRVEPGNTNCAASTRGVAIANLLGGDIVGGEIVFCDDSVARSVTVTHELGHAFGLRHSPDARELMFGTLVMGRTPELGSREILIMNLMLRRASGNRFPDSDRGTGAAVFTGQVQIVCE